MCDDCRKANPERGVDFRSEDTGPDGTCVVEGTWNGDGTMTITKITRLPAATMTAEVFGFKPCHCGCGGLYQDGCCWGPHDEGPIACPTIRKREVR